MRIHQTSDELDGVRQKPYQYFVSYAHSNPYGANGFGNLHIGQSTRITDMDQVRSIEKLLREMSTDRHTSYVVLNYVLLKEPE